MSTRRGATMRSESRRVGSTMHRAARLLSIAFAAAAATVGHSLPVPPAVANAAAPSASVAARAGQWTTADLSVGRTETVVATFGTKILFAAGCTNRCETPRSWEPSDAVDIYDNATDR